MAVAQEVKIVCENWSDDAAADLLPLFIGDDPKPDAVLASVRDKVEKGRAMLYGIYGPKRVGSLVLAAWPSKRSGYCLEVAYARGNFPGASLINTVMPFVMALARSMGMVEVFTETKRKGMARRLREWGFERAGIAGDGSSILVSKIDYVA